MEAQATALAHRGHEVAIFAARTDDAERAPLYRLRSAARVATGWGTSPLRSLRTFRPDVIHVHNLFPNFGTSWLRRVDAPLVITLHNYRPVCVNAVLLRDGVVCTLCPDGARWSGVRHGCYRGSRLASAPLAIANRHGAEQHPLLNRPERIVVLTQAQHEIYQRAGIPSDRMAVVPNFMPSHLVPPRVSIQGSTRSGYLFVGRLSAEKRILDLIDAWPRDAALTVIGDGPLARDVRDLAAGKNISILGHGSPHVVRAHMITSARLIFPSAALEGLPLVYIEALACGLPTIATGPSIVSHLVREERTGESASTIQELIGLVGERKVEPALAERCRDVFEANYSEDVVCELLERAYSEVTRS